MDQSEQQKMEQVRYNEAYRKGFEDGKAKGYNQGFGFGMVCLIFMLFEIACRRISGGG
jgi:hypothetical protein